MDTGKKVLRLIQVQEGLIRAINKLTADPAGASKLTKFEKECVAEYADLYDEVESDILSSAVIASPDPRVRQYVEGSLSTRLQAIAETDGEISPEEEHHLLYSWFSPWTYCQTIMATERLHSKYPVPDDLARFVDNARQCFALHQYTATVALSRAMLEKAFTDLAVSKGLIPPPGDADYFRDYPPHQRLTKLLGYYNPLRKQIARVYSEASKVIHGAESAEAAQLFFCKFSRF